MANFKCTNQNCQFNGIKVEHEVFSFIISDGRLVPKHDIQCPNCKSKLEFIEETVNPKDITTTFGKFKSSSSEDKKRMIKERNTQNTSIAEKRQSSEKRKDIINDIKEKFTGTIKNK